MDNFKRISTINNFLKNFNPVPNIFQQEFQTLHLHLIFFNTANSLNLFIDPLLLINTSKAFLLLTHSNHIYLI